MQETERKEWTNSTRSAAQRSTSAWRALGLGSILLVAVTGCTSPNHGGGVGVSDPPAQAATLSPPPARFSFRAQDDPVGYVPEATSQAPNPAVASYNPDGTRVDCPASTTTSATHTYPGLSGAAATVAFLRKQLSGSGCVSAISFPTASDTSYTVYSSVPESMTIAYGYANPATYFDSSQIADWHNGTTIPPNNSAVINCGAASATASATSTSGDGTSVLLASNSSPNCAAYSQFYIPNLPNTKSTDGTSDVDHNGLTENILWNTDEYLPIAYDSVQYPAAQHLFQFGWAFDPRNIGQDIFWNNMNNIASNGPSVDFVQTQPSEGNALIWTIQGKYWCNNPLTCTTTDYTKISTPVKQNSQYPFPDPTTWLKNGAFLPYQPMPGFQRNLVREYTPSGAFTILNNTSGLFVRKDGTTEFPLDRNGRPYPAVVQTWDSDQQFVVVNRTSGAVTATNDSYPGDEVYYLGNTYLPGQAGVVTHWAYYPWISLDTGGQFGPSYLNGSVKHGFDQRASDGWLGMKNDLPEDVLAWNNSTQVGQIDTVQIGGQARKPYMFGAGEQFGAIGQVQQNKNTPFPPANVDIRHIMQLEHSNSYHLWRVKNDDGAAMQQNNLYKTSLYMTDSNGNYIWIASLAWTFEQNWGFADDTQPVIWTSNKKDGYGAWVQSLTINPVITSGVNLPAGWVWQSNADDHGLALLTFPNGNVSIKAIQSTWLGSGINWNNQVSWNAGGPGKGTTPRANQAGTNAVRFQIVGNAGDTKTKFVLALEDLP